jgi:hypothetical protein
MARVPAPPGADYSSRTGRGDSTRRCSGLQIQGPSLIMIIALILLNALTLGLFHRNPIRGVSSNQWKTRRSRMPAT